MNSYTPEQLLMCEKCNLVDYIRNLQDELKGVKEEHEEQLIDKNNTILTWKLSRALRDTEIKELEEEKENYKKNELVREAKLQELVLENKRLKEEEYDPHEYGECENCGVSMTEDDSLNGEGCCEACNTYG